MFNYLEKLRQKPERSKNRFAFLSAFSFAGIIFVIWLSVVYPNFTEQKKREDKVRSLEQSPLSSFFENVSVGFGEVGENVSSIKDFAINIFNQSQYLKNDKSVGTTSENVPIEKFSNSIEIINVSDAISTTTSTTTEVE